MRVGIAGGNVYIDFLISGLVEFPAAFLILFTIDRIGRRLPFATANIVAGASCIVAAIIPDGEFDSEIKLDDVHTVCCSSSLSPLRYVLV